MNGLPQAARSWRAHRRRNEAFEFNGLIERVTDQGWFPHHAPTPASVPGNPEPTPTGKGKGKGKGKGRAGARGTGGGGGIQLERIDRRRGPGDQGDRAPLLVPSAVSSTGFDSAARFTPHPDQHAHPHTDGATAAARSPLGSPPPAHTVSAPAPQRPREVSASHLKLLKQIGGGSFGDVFQVPFAVPLLLTKTSNIFRVGIFLDFVKRPGTTRTPHGAYVRRAKGVRAESQTRLN